MPKKSKSRNARLTRFRAAAGKGSALVLVHGFRGHPVTTWGRFPDLIIEDPRLNAWDVYSFRYSTGLIPDIPGAWSGKPDLETLATSLATVLTTDLCDYARLALFGHGMGGLIVQRTLLNRPEIRDRTGCVVLFGTSFLGLRKTFGWRSLLVQARDMAPGSRFLTDLQNDWREIIGERPGFGFRAVFGEKDRYTSAEQTIEPYPRSFRKVVTGDHVTLVKPEDKDDQRYRVATELLLPGDRARLNCVFLSYAREDEDRVRRVYECLEKAGFEPWMDTADVRSGSKWRASINDALAQAGFVLVFQSHSFLEALKEGDVLAQELRQTIEHASLGNKFLIPVRLEDCISPGPIASYQWIDLFDADNTNELVSTIKSIADEVRTAEKL